MSEADNPLLRWHQVREKNTEERASASDARVKVCRPPPTPQVSMLPAGSHGWHLRGRGPGGRVTGSMTGYVTGGGSRTD